MGSRHGGPLKHKLVVVDGSSLQQWLSWFMKLLRHSALVTIKLLRYSAEHASAAPLADFMLPAD